jgi:hypothetical protein
MICVPGTPSKIVYTKWFPKPERRSLISYRVIIFERVVHRSHYKSLDQRHSMVHANVPEVIPRI